MEKDQRQTIYFVGSCPFREKKGKTSLYCFRFDGNERSVLKGLGGKEKAGIDIIFCQARILFQDILYGGSMRQELQDVLHGQPCASDDWFSYHYPGINRDPV